MPAKPTPATSRATLRLTDNQIRLVMEGLGRVLRDRAGIMHNPDAIRDEISASVLQYRLQRLLARRAK